MTSVVFVSDFFSDEIVGGAELTSDAIISECNTDITKVKSIDVNEDFIKSNINSRWIFGNFTQVKRNILINIIKSGMRYDIIEYDFKFCIMRSPKKHAFFHGECNCKEDIHGKLISLFFSKSRKLWFMSEKQKQVYHSQFPFLKKNNTEILSSVFADQTLNNIVSLEKNKSNKYIILNSNSWIKATQDCIQYAVKNKLKYELVSNLSHRDLLKKLASSKGLIFLPSGGDTCPRITIEAKLLGCDLRLNGNVLHKDEAWFSGNVDTTLEYLKNNKSRFWESFNES